VRSTNSDAPEMSYLVITKSKTSRVADGFYGLVVGVVGPNIREEVSRLLLSREFQSTCLPLRSRAINTGKPPT
jgi:hypothetical protein